MIAFGVCVGPTETFDRVAAPAIEAIRVPTDRLLLRYRQRSIFEAYNSITDEASELEHLEALVLIHDDVELRERPNLEPIFADGAAIAGVIGARNNEGIAWFHASETFGRAIDLSGEIAPRPGTHGVDIIDGLLIALSPWAVHNLRWDQRRYRGFHGYEGDICEKAKAAGRKVVVTDISHLHHSRQGYGGGWNDWRRNELRWQRLWRPLTIRKRVWSYAMEGRLAVARLTSR